MPRPRLLYPRESCERTWRQGEAAEEVLPGVFRRLFAATDEPFVQAIYDLSVPRMAFGRA